MLFLNWLSWNTSNQWIGVINSDIRAWSKSIIFDMTFVSLWERVGCNSPRGFNVGWNNYVTWLLNYLVLEQFSWCFLPARSVRDKSILFTFLQIVEALIILWNQCSCPPLVPFVAGLTRVLRGIWTNRVDF